MDLGTVLSAAQTLFAALQCSELKGICALFGYESELENLRRTMLTVGAVLKDAEAKQDGLKSMTNQAQLYIDELKDAVYDADDLLDEFITMIDQKKELIAQKGPILGEIHRLFSRLNPLSFAGNMSKNVNNIRNKLDGIADNHSQFGFKIDYEPNNVGREETCSYVNESDIIGRKADVRNLLAMLVSSSSEDNNQDGRCNFVSIVGLGGLGKTALAQLVFNDPSVKAAFPLRMWVCVSDQDQSQLGVKETFLKILRSVVGDDRCNGYTLDKVKSELQQLLAENKYLLVLDDVWTEDREDWLTLEEFINGGKKGSWVIVTTRSMETAKIVGSGLSYQLGGLSFDYSWRLFQRMAFGQANPTDDFVEIGREIVQKCARVPLAIRVVGSLLYGQSESKWRLFQQNGLAYIGGDKNGIRSLLKLSYYYLKSPLKSCFSYCAIFPKNYVIRKEMILSLWMAQGYVVPFYDGQSIVDAAEECFLILLRRCFFQDVRRNVYGEIVSFKMHDLMHDIAQYVAGKEICEVLSNPAGLDNERVRHLSLAEEKFLKTSSAKMIHIRSCLGVGGKDKELLIGLILKTCVRLRSLNLSDTALIILPESVGNLLHLRYLDLSRNTKLKELPKTITKLRNLLTLKLSGCRELQELPKDLRKLHKLHILDISGCVRLEYLPSGIGELSHLHTLCRYMVGLTNSNVKECSDQLEDLKTLNNLKGTLNIDIQAPRNATYVKQGDKGGTYIQSKEHLTCIELAFKHEGSYDSVEYEEALLEELQPHSNLMELRFKKFSGVRLPTWARGDKFARCLPNLVTLEFVSCEALECLPELGRLCRLKKLRLVNLPKLKYVEDEYNDRQRPLSFPCLEDVHLQDLPKLEAWYRGSVVNDPMGGVEPSPLSLPRFKNMVIVVCPKMAYTHVEGVRIYSSVEDWTNSFSSILLHKSWRYGLTNNILAAEGLALEESILVKEGDDR